MPGACLFLCGFLGELSKEAKAVHMRDKEFRKRPDAKVEKIYYGMKRNAADLKKRYGARWKEVASRTALKRTPKTGE